MHHFGNFPLAKYENHVDMHVAATATARTSTMGHLWIASTQLFVSCKHNVDAKPKLEKLREKKNYL